MTSLARVDSTELKKLLQKSNNKTCGLDPCPATLLQTTFEAHESTILNMFNCSFQHGIFPYPFKSADMRHILNKTWPQNMLVSSLPALGKLLEILPASRLIQHTTRLRLEEKFQSADN